MIQILQTRIRISFWYTLGPNDIMIISSATMYSSLSGTGYYGGHFPVNNR